MIRLEPLRPQHCGLLSGLMNRYYARQRPVEYFLWQYFDYPWRVSSVGAFAGDRLVGHFGLQRKPLSGGQWIDQVMDIIIDGEYRSSGLFRRLWDAVRADIGSDGSTLVLANADGKDACVRKLAFQQVAQLDALALTSDDLREGRSGDIPTPRCRLLLDSDLLEWRFRRHPLFEYRFHGDPDGSLVVTKMFVTEQSRQGDIVYFHGPPSPDHWKEACLQLFAQGATQVNSWSFPGTAERSLMLKMGFRALPPQARYFCLRTSDLSLYRAERWNIAPADTEHF